MTSRNLNETARVHGVVRERLLRRSVFGGLTQPSRLILVYSNLESKGTIMSTVNKFRAGADPRRLRPPTMPRCPLLRQARCGARHSQTRQRAAPSSLGYLGKGANHPRL